MKKNLILLSAVLFVLTTAGCLPTKPEDQSTNENQPALPPVIQNQDNEALETKPDNEKAEIANPNEEANEAKIVPQDNQGTPAP